MPSQNVWGPATWIFLHTLVSKLKEDKFSVIGKHIFFYIKRICTNLPCPECSDHAGFFLSKINESSIVSKASLINTMYIFHNSVNKRKNKLQYNFEYLKMYEKYNLIETFNNFSRVFNTKGNMNLISQSFQRQFLMKNLKNWLIKNYIFFNR